MTKHKHEDLKVKVTTKKFDPPLEVEEKKPKKKDQVLVRCPGCPWRPGLMDEKTVCPKCEGTGLVPADPLE